MQLLSIKVEIFECGIQVNQKWLNWQKMVENSPVFLISFSTDKKTSQKATKIDVLRDANIFN